MDVLDDILKTLDLRGAVYFRTDFSGCWATTVPDYENAARFHLVVQGRCHVVFPSGDHVELAQGDMVLVPNGRRHVLSDSGLAKAPPLETVLSDAGYDGRGVLRLGAGDGAASTQMVCGHFSFRKGAEHPVLSSLPEHVLVTASDRASQPWLDDTLKLVAQHMFANAPGTSATVTRLSEIVFVELIKSGIMESTAAHDLMTAFRDPQIGNALNCIHEQPGRDWSVQTLAQEIGMSRSRFSDRFSTLVGVTPMKYLADWRMQKALAALEQARTSIQEIAFQSGYQSTAAFSRAFATKFGFPPSAMRRELAH